MRINKKTLLAAALAITFTACDDLGQTGEVKAGTYTLGGLIHRGTFDVTTGEAKANTSTTATADWSLSDNSLKDATGDLTFTSIVYPQTLASALTFKATIDGQTYTNSTSIKLELTAGTSYTYTITGNKTGLTVSGCTVSNWNTGTAGTGTAEM